MVSRRALMQAGVATAGAAALGGCATLGSRYAAAPLPTTLRRPTKEGDRLVKGLNRIGFGPTPALIEEIGGDWDGYVVRQLSPSADDNPALRIALQGVAAYRMSSIELRDEPEHDVLRGLQQAALLRALYSRWQLQERVVGFWTNHFNIYGRKGLAAYRLGGDQLQVVRAHAFGKFSDLVKASAQSPAMLAYLDNQLNVNGGPNENYARELMELHTLGVHGGYSQEDVREVARCFTGWTYETRYMRPRGKFRFDETRHDFGEKKVLGATIPAGGGMEDGVRVIEMLANHPATAKFVTQKLCRYFTGDADSKIQAKAERVFTDTKGDLREVVRTIVTSPDLIEGPPMIKRPFDFVTSALRALNATTTADRPLQGHLDRMGQPLYQWPMPDGYPDGVQEWTGSLLARWNFAWSLAHGEIGGTSYPFEALEKLIIESPELLASNLTHVSDMDKVEFVDGREAIAVALASPEFQWR